MTSDSWRQEVNLRGRGLWVACPRFGGGLIQVAVRRHIASPFFAPRIRGPAANSFLLV